MAAPVDGSLVTVVRPRIKNSRQLFGVVGGVAVGAHAVDSETLVGAPSGVMLRTPVAVDAAIVVPVVRQKVPESAELPGGIR